MTFGCPPTTLELIGALRFVATIVGTECLHHDGRFHFPIDDDWSLALSADSAGRIRVEASCRGRTVDVRWAQAQDRRRLSALALGLREQVLIG